MPKRLVTLELSPAEARALHSCLDNELWTLREHGVGTDELPRCYARLEHVQRLVADGLDYLRQQPSEAAIRTGIPDPPARAE